MPTSRRAGRRDGGSARTRRHPLQVVPVMIAALLAVSVASPAFAAGTDWPAYLYGPRHHSWAPSETAITPANASGIAPDWTWQPDPPVAPNTAPALLTASPTVYEGTIYIGANTGTFYAIDDSNGQVLWSRFLGSQPSLSCPPPALGFTSTATVALDPTSHEPTVYVAAADGNLYALDASTGDTVWSAPVVTPSTTVNDYYIWGSPTLVSGKLLIGISSNCDTPLVRGGVAEFSQASGARLATWFSVPKGSVGGSVWSSLAAGNASVFATTGNAATRRQTGYIDSVVKLSLDGLKVLGSWKVPPPAQLVDGDFGASPVTYTGHVSGSAVPMVAACNKNGWLYVLRANALGLGPVWKAQLATSKPAGTHHCLASAVFDGRHLIAAAAASVVGGTEYLGSVREFDASTGAPLWEMGLPAEVLGTPALNGSGVLAVATFDQSGAPNSAYLLDASTGKILTTLPTGADGEFAQPVFADGHLFLATLDQGLTAYSVP